MDTSMSRFTAPEGGTRLAVTARTKNIIVTDHTMFIATQLLHEEAYQIRGSLFDGKKRSFYITRESRVRYISYDIGILTDLKVISAVNYDEVYDWYAELETKYVIVCTAAVLKRLLEESMIDMSAINVMIIDSSHLIHKDDNLQYIMNIFKKCKENEQPRILSLTRPFFSSIKKDKTDFTITCEHDTNSTVDQCNDSDVNQSNENDVDQSNENDNCNSNDIIDQTETSSDKLSADNTEVKIDIKNDTEYTKIDNDVGRYENFDDFDMYEKVEGKIDFLEENLCCQADLAEDIDPPRRIPASVAKPKELIIEYETLDRNRISNDYLELEKFMRDTAENGLRFINDHRYDPSEIYGEDLYEEFKNIPDPTIEPKLILSQFLYVLEELGPYGADKAAFSLLTKLEKLRIKVPYERHFLLLCSCTSMFVKIRCYADLILSKYNNEWEKIKQFSTPKVLRFAEILEKFKPDKSDIDSNDSNDKVSNKFSPKDLVGEIDKLDFVTLGNKIEDKINTLACGLKDLDVSDNVKSDIKQCNDTCENSVEIGNENDNSSNDNVDTNQNVDISNQNNETNINNDSNKNDSNDTKKTDDNDNSTRRVRRYGRTRAPRKMQNMAQHPDSLCCVVFIKESLMAKIIFSVVIELSRSVPSLNYICAQYCSIDKIADPLKEIKEYESQRRKQEEVLKKFRMHECNLLLATSFLEEGIDLPRCNLILRWDVPASYKSHVLCLSRARAAKSTYLLLANKDTNTNVIVENMAAYKELDQIVTRKCGCGIQNEPPQTDEDYADLFTKLILPYTPEKNDKNYTCNDAAENSNDIDVDMKNDIDNSNHNDTIQDSNGEVVKSENDTISNDIKCDDNDAIVKSDNVVINSNDNDISNDKKIKNDIDNVSVDLSSAIALINRYCGKLPSDTFTRLAPQYTVEKIFLPKKGSKELLQAYVCTLRMPLNCPVKYNIVGHPMPTEVLARRMVALQACRVLHKNRELDNQLMPIGKENFKAAELDIGMNVNCDDPNDIARPGTTKRRQYYYKKTSEAFTDCEPEVNCTDEEVQQPYDATKCAGVKKVKKNVLFALTCTLCCALPERYNTRGRKLHSPQNAKQALAILMCSEHENLHIPSFPVYTRSGEVRVSVEYIRDADVRMSPTRARVVRRFMRFVFAEVLRVRRRGMKLASSGLKHNNYYIVPTIKSTKPDGSTKIDVDWSFLDLIYKFTEEKKALCIDNPLSWHFDDEEMIGSDKNDDDTIRNNDDINENNDEKDKSDIGNIDGEELDKIKPNDNSTSDSKMMDETQNIDGDKRKPKRRIENIKKHSVVNPHLKPGEVFVFDPEKYKDAVVTPWYRNQDQPQFFLVAEICWNLTLDSEFPSTVHKTFRSYYEQKYGVTLTQSDQPLLDVDHTSARLNLLTPRYVNRKGVALPVSSERTRRIKRDCLEQKQMLVPELSSLHPFPAALWFATVMLPCVLYRINGLLIADEIRKTVALEVGLGKAKITDPNFQWKTLDFGWSLAEVLNSDGQKNEKESPDNQEDEKEEDCQEEVTEDTDIVKNEDCKEDTQEKTLNDILQEKEVDGNFEIGMWSNDMASSIPDDFEYDEMMEPLPSNLTFCTSASGGTNWCDPVEKPKSKFNPSKAFSMAESDCSYMSSDFDTDDSDLNSVCSDDLTETSGFCSGRTSNTVRIEYKTAHEAEALDPEKKPSTAPQPDELDEVKDAVEHHQFMVRDDVEYQYKTKFREATENHKKNIENIIINGNQEISEILPVPYKTPATDNIGTIPELIPYDTELPEKIDLDAIETSKQHLLNEFKKTLSKDEINKLKCFSMNTENKDGGSVPVTPDTDKPSYDYNPDIFDFDYQPDLNDHPGPSPSVILQALTMSNANDGINLERLETIGDSFLKFAITTYLYCTHPNVHEGKLSHMRSKQVSNLNLYRLGRNKKLGALMIASKFEPHDNWLPPCHEAPATVDVWSMMEPEQLKNENPNDSCYIPYNLITQHSIPDKSIADCVEALIGAYLIECGPKGALKFMCWLGVKVLPYVDDTKPTEKRKNTKTVDRTIESESECEVTDDETNVLRNGEKKPIYGELKPPPSPLLRYVSDPNGELEMMLSGYEELENTLQYRFRDRSLLLQAMTHVSHQSNRLTDCYQRLEFLGDAILDYLITRHLYEDQRRHSPGALTDLRSALVNNTIFATLAVRYGFHKFFRHMSPGLNEVIAKYVKVQEENGHSISEEHYLLGEDPLAQAEDVEVPKALGDLFESLAGAIFLDSGMSLASVWRPYERLMRAELESLSAAAPKSPVRRLLEAEPDTAKFGKPERLADGRRVRVSVEVFGRGTFKGIGRNYRIAKGTAARCALRHLKRMRCH